MIIHEAGLGAPAHWWRLEGGGGRCPRPGPAVRGGAEPRSAFRVGRDVVLLWRSAECGIAVRSDTTVGSTPSPSGSPSAGSRAPRAAPSSASQSRKCRLLALSLRDKWLQLQHCSELSVRRPCSNCEGGLEGISALREGKRALGENPSNPAADLPSKSRQQAMLQHNPPQPCHHH